VVRSQQAEQSLTQGSAREKLIQSTKTLNSVDSGKTSGMYRMGISQVLYGGEFCLEGVSNRTRSDAITLKRGETV
jgi:hypothetical protein